MMAKKFWVCSVCGDIHFGDKAPEVCPTCKSKNAYEEIGKEAAKKRMGI
jgi:rubrerythrin